MSTWFSQCAHEFEHECVNVYFCVCMCVSKHNGCECMCVVCGYAYAISNICAHVMLLTPFLQENVMQMERGSSKIISRQLNGTVKLLLKGMQMHNVT